MSSTESNFFKIGSVGRAQGLKGQVTLLLKTPEVLHGDAYPEVILQKNNEQLPVSLQELLFYPKKTVAKFDGIDDRTKAESLKGYEVLISRPNSNPTQEDFNLGDLQGFKVLCDQKVLGNIDSFETNGHQDLLRVKSDETFFLVPLIDEFIVDLDFENEEITMDLPEGLTNLTVS